MDYSVYFENDPYRSGGIDYDIINVCGEEVKVNDRKRIFPYHVG